MGWIGETIDSIKSIQIRQVLSQAVSLGMIVTSALIIWKALMCITGSESPVVVVLSGSMEPGFKRLQASIFMEAALFLLNMYEFVSSWALTSGEGGRHNGPLGPKINNGIRGWVDGLVEDYLIPVFEERDILFLHMSKDPIRAGEIVVFNVDGREIPIVHRVIKLYALGSRSDFKAVLIFPDVVRIILPIRVSTISMLDIFHHDMSKTLEVLVHPVN
ncbi:Signal peptidase complex catalytic subunit SEC11A [Vitis vinifera]|uniref:Signal peptidase complex catalytic subunit SEC11 n=1 Tax=Vitis vinifera TaxID=29760 RepID=A0A438HIY0_VITVI|nr:Signal peptidase complex catalytic subunit SEC11A [Vitis vinifera]